ncbi:MAG TPA: M28 family peptidase, partial [Gemmatimonadaceae bacterium]|nr:M28 family peptidase [Gemmatimonadaceae bacterium]
GAAASDAWGWLVGLGVLAGIPIVLTTVGARSHGALDNASGVTVVVGAALALPPDAAIGVLLTSAEELGLAGARAWARTREGGVAINGDGVDDVGRATLMYSGPAPRRVIAAFAGEARVRQLVPGILTDGVALADAGWEVVTLSRGSWTSLLRVHRPADDLLHLQGDCLDETAHTVAEATRRLLTHRGAAEGER